MNTKVTLFLSYSYKLLGYGYTVKHGSSIYGYKVYGHKVKDGIVSSGVGNGNVFSASKRKITNKAVTNQGFGTYKRYAKNLNGHFLDSGTPHRTFSTSSGSNPRIEPDSASLNARRILLQLLFWFYLFSLLSIWISLHQDPIGLQYIPQSLQEVYCNIYRRVFFYSVGVRVYLGEPVYEQLVLMGELAAQIFVTAWNFLVTLGELLYNIREVFLTYLHRACDQILALLTEFSTPSEIAHNAAMSLVITLPIDWLFTSMLVFIFVVFSSIIIIKGLVVWVLISIPFCVMGWMFLFSILLFLYLYYTEYIAGAQAHSFKVIYS